MSFPLSRRGNLSVRINSDCDIQSVVAALEVAITRLKPSLITTIANEISFKAGPFRFVPNWNMLIPISSGKVTVMENDGWLIIEYSVSFLHLLILISLIVIVLFGVLPISANASLENVIGMVVLAWFILFGGNYVSTVLRFPNYLQDTVEDVIKARLKQRQTGKQADIH